jgi:hypothetical protein
VGASVSHRNQLNPLWDDWPCPTYSTTTEIPAPTPTSTLVATTHLSYWYGTCLIVFSHDTDSDR